MRGLVLVVVGLLLGGSSFYLWLDTPLTVAHQTLTGTSVLSYDVGETIGNVAVNVSWQVTDGSPIVSAAYCPAGTLLNSAGCPDPQSLLGAVYSPYNAPPRAISGWVPAGGVLLVVLTGDSNASAEITVHSAAPVFAGLIGLTGLACILAAAWWRTHKSPVPREEPGGLSGGPDYGRSDAPETPLPPHS